MAANYWTSAQRRAVDDFSHTGHAQDLEYGLDEAQILQLYRYFFDYARAICQSPRKNGSPFLRRRVWATACIYMRDFYREQSFATADPRQLCLASLLLASKVEETPIHTRDLVAVAIHLANNSPERWPLPPSPEQVVSAEARIMVNQSRPAAALLLFDPVPSLLAGLQLSGLQKDSASVKLAWGLLTDSFISDAHLRYHPSEIALACVVMTGQLQGVDIGQWLAGINADIAKVFSIAQCILRTFRLCQTPLNLDMCRRYLAFVHLE